MQTQVCPANSIVCFISALLLVPRMARGGSQLACRVGIAAVCLPTTTRPEDYSLKPMLSSKPQPAAVDEF
jgi:hypothetical protein